MVDLGIPTKGYSKRDVEKVRQMVRRGPVIITISLDGTDTEDILRLGGSVDKVSLQRTGDLQANVSFSVNGVDFQDTVAVTTNALASYSTHNVTHVKVVRTAGSGKIMMAGN